MERKIVRDVLENPHLAAKEIINHVKTAVWNVSTKTVTRWLHQAGLQTWCPRKTKHLKSRLFNGRSHLKTLEWILVLCFWLHHHFKPLAQISLTLSRHFSLSFITSGRSSALHPISSQSCCMYVLAGRLALAHPYVGVHRSTSLMSLSLLLQQCPACLVRLTWIVKSKNTPLQLSPVAGVLCFGDILLLLVLENWWRKYRIWSIKSNICVL